METLDKIIFYSIDRAIRTYRQYAQAQIKKQGYSITVDQWLIIKCLIENPTISQVELSELVFKDNASVTRIISLLVKSKYLTRKMDKSDRRRTILTVTDLGLETIAAVDEIVLVNRSVALEGLSEDQIANAKIVMQAIALNCKK